LGIPKAAQIRFKADFWGSVMDCDELRHDQWERLKDLAPGGTKGRRGPRTDNRRFLNALLWMTRSGGRWRGLPARLGGYHTVKRRYYRWIAMGVLEAMFAALAREADLEWLMIDATIVRAHQQAAEARRKKGGRMPKALAAPEGV
jgi:transposase